MSARLTGLVFTLCAITSHPAAHGQRALRPVACTEVVVDDGFWAERIRINREVTIPFALAKCEETGRIANFAVAGGLEEGGFRGIYFDDSDVFKVLEGAAYSLRTHPDPELETVVDGVIAKIAAAQEEDGYLYTARTIGDPSYDYPGKEGRWTHVAHGHELYNVGHLYEAAVAHYQATGKRTLLDVAVRNADLICRVFGPGEGQRYEAPGHQEIEIGLLRLHRATGEPAYLRQARFFLEARGRADRRRLFGAYSQDHQPVLEQEAAVGHAVRAGYLYAGMADYAVASGDRRYERAARRIWEEILAGKTYVTGGVGARRAGEAFGDPYELPDESAYNETCAAIAQAFLHHRVFLLSGEARAIDALERVLHNGFLAGIAMRGDRFFYPNPLACDGRTAFNMGVLGRSPWFHCSCCPVNVVRFVPRIGEYVYALGGADQLFVNLYVGSRTQVELAGTRVALRQTSAMPWTGSVRLALDPERAADFELRLRVPGYLRGRPYPGALYRDLEATPRSFRVRVNDAPFPGEVDANGYVSLRRTWRPGDAVEIDFPLAVRRVVADERVAATRDRVALERGPLVYCLEGCDHEGRVTDLLLADDVAPEIVARPELLGGIVAIVAPGERLERRPDGSIGRRRETLTAVPYYAWAHREVGEMQVWIARRDDTVRVAPVPTLASRARASASHVWQGDVVAAIHDQVDPASSGDHGVPRHTFWPRQGTREWLQYDFSAPTALEAVEVYWFDDTGRGRCRVPASWRLLWKDGETWRTVEASTAYGVAKDGFNEVRFAPVTTTALRLEVQLAEGVSAGVLEWRVR